MKLSLKKIISVGVAALLAVSVLQVTTASAASKLGTSCSKVGAKATVSGRRLVCTKLSKKLVWVANPAKPAINLPSAGASCATLGQQIVTDASNYLECRYVHSMKLQWFSLSKTPTPVTNALAPASAISCQVKDLHNVSTSPDGTMAHGFPVNSINPRFPKAGVIEVALLPIDFTDFKGEQDIQTEVQNTMDKMSAWIKYYSQGQANFHFTYLSTWTHAGVAASTFDDKVGYPNLTYNDALAKISQAYVNLAPASFDFTKIAVYLPMFPKAENTISTNVNLGVRPESTLQGLQTFEVFGEGANSISQNQPFWAIAVHAIMHSVGIAGHAPGEGFHFNIMTNQNGASYSLSAWDQYILGWLPDAQNYCIGKEDIDNQVVTISPMEREDTGTKMIEVPLDDHSALVVESHGMGEWASSEPDNSYPNGFYAVMAYRIDTRFGNNRTCENTANGPSASANSGTKDAPCPVFDNGNDPNYPKFAYFLPVDGGPSTDITAFGKYSAANEILKNYTAVQGDSFTSDGIRFTVVKSGNQDSIQISLVK